MGLSGSWERDGFAFSPTTAYSLLSGPNPITPPLWFVARLKRGSRRITVYEMPTFPLARIRTMRLYVVPFVTSLYVWYAYTYGVDGNPGSSARPRRPRSPPPSVLGRVMNGVESSVRFARKMIRMLPVVFSAKNIRPS